MAQHGAKGGDPRAAGDEEKAPLVGFLGERESPDGALDIDERPRLQLEMRPRLARFVNADQQLEPVVQTRVLGR